MKTYTIQASNHPGAGSRVPTEEAANSWFIVYDGKLISDLAARQTVDRLSDWFKHVRVFRGGTLGKFHYAVLR